MIEYRHLWQLVDVLTAKYASDEDGVAPDSLLPLLQSQMQRDIRNIIDELEIMMQIIREQRGVVREFARHVIDILASPESDPKHGSGSGEPTPALAATITQVQPSAFAKVANDFLTNIQTKLDELGRLQSSASGTQQIV